MIFSLHFFKMVDYEFHCEVHVEIENANIAILAFPSSLVEFPTSDVRTTMFQQYISQKGIRRGKIGERLFVKLFNRPSSGKLSIENHPIEVLKHFRDLIIEKLVQLPFVLDAHVQEPNIKHDNQIVFLEQDVVIEPDPDKELFRNIFGGSRWGSRRNSGANQFPSSVQIQRKRSNSLDLVSMSVPSSPTMGILRDTCEDSIRSLPSSSTPK